MCNIREYVDMHTFFTATYVSTYIAMVYMATAQQYQTYKTICKDIVAYTQTHTNTNTHIHTLHSAKQSIILRFHIHLWSEAAYTHIYAST